MKRNVVVSVPFRRKRKKNEGLRREGGGGKGGEECSHTFKTFMYI